MKNKKGLTLLLGFALLIALAIPGAWALASTAGEDSEAYSGLSDVILEDAEATEGQDFTDMGTEGVLSPESSFDEGNANAESEDGWDNEAGEMPLGADGPTYASTLKSEPPVKSEIVTPAVNFTNVAPLGDPVVGEEE